MPASTNSNIVLEKKSSDQIVSTPSATSAQVTNMQLPADGGAKAWMTIVGGWLAVFATFGYANSFGVYQDFYTRSEAASASQISWIGSTQLFFLIAMGLPAGKLFDMGYFRVTVIFGTVLYVFSIFMLSLAHPDKYYQLFLSQGIGMGIGSGFIYMPATAVQSHHWLKHRPLAMGIVATGSSAGGIAYPIMLNQLLHGKVGFAWGVRASAFLTLGILVIAVALMIPGPPKPKTQVPSPKALVTDPPYILTVLGVLVAMLGLFFPYFYLQLYMILHGVDATLAFYTLAILNGASVFGRTLPNFLAQKIGIFNTLIPVTVITGALIFAIFGVKDAAGSVVLAVLYGFFSGAFISLLGPTTAVLAKDASEIGLRMGFAFFVSAFGALVGTPIDGKLLGHTFEWHRAIVFSAVTSLGGAALLIVARVFFAKRKASQFV